MSSERAEFNKATKQKIAKKANYLCSFNSGGYRCLRLTSCKSIDLNKGEREESPLLMGEASHIVAATKNGPRGDVEMTPEDRAKEENGIWLCQIHAAWIDKDNGNGYSIEQLHEMKQSHEEYIRRALEEGNCEYLSYQNGSNVLTVIYDFSYPETMYRGVIAQINKDNDLTDEQTEMDIQQLKQSMKAWEKEPIEYRQLAGVVYQYGSIPLQYGVPSNSVRIPFGKLVRLMNNNRRLVDDFIVELENQDSLVGEFVPRDDGSFLDNPDVVYMYNEYLYYLKKMYPDFNFQKLFMFGEADFENVG